MEKIHMIGKSRYDATNKNNPIKYDTWYEVLLTSDVIDTLDTIEKYIPAKVRPGGEEAATLALSKLRTVIQEERKKLGL